MVLRDRALERDYVMNGIIMTFRKRPEQLSCPLLPCKDTARSLQPRRGPSPDHAVTQISDFQPCELREIN